MGTYSSSAFNYRWYIEEYSTKIQNGALGSVDFTCCFRTASTDSITYTFNVLEAGTYALQTARKSEETYFDTTMTLYSGGVACTDDSGNTTYSSLTKWLDIGTYVIQIFKGSVILNFMESYLTISRAEERYASIDVYMNTTDNCRKIGDATPFENESPYYNCLGYALGLGTWISPKTQDPNDVLNKSYGTVTQVDTLMNGYGYTRVSSLTNNCVIAYGTTSEVVHFAKYQNGIVKAKLGRYELVEHYKEDSYYDEYYVTYILNGVEIEENIAYGNPVAYYVKS